MAGIKSLAKDTALYGLSSIVGRFLNWMLVPLYTNMFPVAEYGVVTFVYSVVALVMVILTYGMETGFFRFANHEKWSDPMEVYTTSMMSLAASSTTFMLLVALFINPVSQWMECAGHPSYVLLMACCVGMDAFMTIPYSYIRFRKRPMRFALLKLVNIGINIGLNLFFIVLCPWLLKHAPGTVSSFYDPSYGIGYIFLSNFMASAINLIMLWPELHGFKWRFTATLWKQMLIYSMPLLVLAVKAKWRDWTVAVVSLAFPLFACCYVSWFRGEEFIAPALRLCESVTEPSGYSFLRTLNPAGLALIGVILTMAFCAVSLIISDRYSLKVKSRAAMRFNALLALLLCGLFFLPSGTATIFALVAVPASILMPLIFVRMGTGFTEFALSSAPALRRGQHSRHGHVTVTRPPSGSDDATGRCR